MMATPSSFGPNIIDSADVAKLREAVRRASEAAGTTSEQELHHLASIVFSFYQRGLVDPGRLADIAVLAFSSRLFNSQYSAGLSYLRSDDRGADL